jgi:SPP1 gp7 family putative phage head morphogenesis protein
VSANDDLQDDMIARAIDLERYKTGFSNRVRKHLERVTADIQRILIESELTEYRKTRLEQMLRDMNKLISAAYEGLPELVEAELKQLAETEAKYVVSAMNGVMGANLAATPTLAPIYAAAAAQPFQGRVLSDWFKKLEDSSKDRIQAQIRIGYTEGETIAQIVSRVRRSTNIDRNSAEAVVRTAVNHISSFSRHSVYEQNDDLIKGYMWVSTLDTRTSDLCKGRDGKVYTLKSRIRPPGHINCRSADTPVLRAASAIEGLPEGTRASMDGQVPASTNYGEWLAKQSIERQEEALGVRKAKLFRDGQLKIDKFSTADGRELSLDELNSRYPVNWEKAFGQAA